MVKLHWHEIRISCQCNGERMPGKLEFLACENVIVWAACFFRPPEMTISSCFSGDERCLETSFARKVKSVYRLKAVFAFQTLSNPFKPFGMNIQDRFLAGLSKSNSG